MTRPPRDSIPIGVWVLGGVSLLMDVSSEMIHSLLPVFLVATLGVSVLVVGVIESVAEATALITRVFSGALSDRLQRRRPLVIAGYALGAISKPLFALAPGAGMVFAARFADRIGKGIRGAPRDALIADLAPANVRGAAFGLRQSLDTVGAFLGPLLAVGLMALWAGDIRAVFAVAVIPATLAVALLVFALEEPARSQRDGVRARIEWARVRTLGTPFWWVVGIGAVFTLARFSEAFLLLRAQQSGVAATWIPLVLVAMNAAYALTAWPAGWLSDRVGSHGLLAAGLLALIFADVLLAQADTRAWLLAGVLAWGLHMGLTQGILAAMVAASAPADLRGTAFGVFHFVAGGATLLASTVAGALWQFQGAAATFFAGAAFAGVALAGLLARGTDAWVRGD